MSAFCEVCGTGLKLIRIYKRQEIVMCPLCGVETARQINVLLSSSDEGAVTLSPMSGGDNSKGGHNE